MVVCFPAKKKIKMTKPADVRKRMLEAANSITDKDIATSRLERTQAYLISDREWAEWSSLINEATNEVAMLRELCGWAARRIAGEDVYPEDPAPILLERLRAEYAKLKRDK